MIDSVNDKKYDIKHTSVLRVNLKNIQSNYYVVKSYVQSKNKQCIAGAVVKGDAYGLGMEEVSKALLKADCEHFFVSRLDEAVKLREVIPNPEIKIYLLNGSLIENLGICKELFITPVCYAIDQIQECQKIGLSFSIQIETGMRRLGVLPEDLTDELLKGCVLILSQYVDSANYRSPFCQQQYEALAVIKEKYPKILMSIANSGGLNWGSDYFMDLVRIGRLLYGTSHDQFEYADQIKTVVTWIVKVLHIQKVPANSGVGYDHLQKTERDSYIATIDAGYYDGIPINAFELGMCALYNTNSMEDPKFLPFIGRTSMDLAMIDITDATEIKTGDWVSILDKNQTLDLLAKRIGVNPRYLSGSIGQSVFREYVY